MDRTWIGVVIGWSIAGACLTGIAFVILKHQWNRWNQQRRPEFDTTPDRPLPFGYKISWLAIQNTSAAEVAAALPLVKRHPANWKSGLDAAYANWVFITPPIDGWVFVVGRDLPDFDAAEAIPDPAWRNFMEAASRRLHRVCYFASHRVVSLAVWSLWENGSEVRTMCYVGESDFRFEHGELTSAEEEVRGIAIAKQRTKLPLGDSEDDPELNRWGPDEEDVLRVAERWSLSPAVLDQISDPTELGIAGRLRNLSR